MKCAGKKLPQGWRWAKLEEICVPIMGQSPPSSSYRKSPEGLPFFQGKADFGEISPVPTAWCVTPKKEALPNDVLLSVRAPVGPTNLADAKCCIGRGLMALRAKKEHIAPEFLLLCLKAAEADISALGSGSTFSSVTKAQISSYTVPLPPLSKQKQVVDQLNKQFAATKRARQSAERALYEAKLLHDALLRGIIPATRSLPKNWRWVKLGDILDYEQPTNYIVSSTKYNEAHQTPVLTAGKTFVLGYTNEKQGIFPSESLPVIIFDDFTTAIKFVDFPFKVKSSAMKILKAKDCLVADIKYVYLAMRLIDFDARTHKRYWISEYSRIEIPFPPLSEQKRMVAKLNQQLAASQQICQSVEAQLSEINLLPNALLREHLLP